MNQSFCQKGFSLVEVLLVIGLIAILATLIIPSISSIRAGAQESTARQQQASLQTALGNWITAASSQSGGLAGARTTYNAAANKLTLLQNYLQPATYANLQGSGDAVSSAALTASGASLQFSTWTVGDSPSIIWLNSP
jgi:prepilin-type N-terminal cleavage/methylation domain-containing protein